ncbi:MAG: hypothetical protein GY854_03335 [Deltaproteobacteria bacterium]|nr:hypothetical protein [Deltaproteobacteria bacterium]
MSEILLKLTRPRMRGPGVKRLQEMGTTLGIGFGKIDGVYGLNTKRGVEYLQRKLGVNIDGVCGPKTWAALLDAVDQVEKEDDDTPPSDVRIIDRRVLHPPPRLFGRKRRWDQIRGVTLHQTGCRMSSRPERWDNLNAHVGITEEGVVILANDPTDMIWHAQRLSPSTIGIEISGNFLGIEEKPNSYWKPGGGPQHLSNLQINAADRLFDWLRDEFKRNGQPWTRVHAHRQSSRTRGGDPGSRVWQEIAMKWIEKLGATDGGPDWKVGTGKPIPREWNPAYPTRFYA